MVLGYAMCDVEIPNPGKFSGYGKFLKPENFLYYLFLQEFLDNLILGLPYPRNFPYPRK